MPLPSHPEAGRIAVLMPSCDRYGSLWPYALGAMAEQWPTHPAKVYVVSNVRECTVPGVVTLKIGEDRSWSDNLIAALDLIDEPYVFMALDDLVFMPGVNVEGLDAAMNRAVLEDWNYLRVNPLPPPREADANGLGPVLPGEAYRASTVMALWKRSTLRALLKPGENAWQFEKYGSERADAYPKWYASAARLVPYLNLITGGRASPLALRKLQALGIDTQGIDFPPMSASEERRLNWLLWRSKMLKLLVPTSLRRRVLAMFTRH